MGRTHVAVAKAQKGNWVVCVRGNTLPPLPSPLWGGQERSDGEGFSSKREYPSLLLRSLPPHKGEGKRSSPQ
ncbi:hypothetical protein FHS21_005206 [Phyllobacterium trifolii]|uniref:Uncharacterized protein n=1 Tax=Phyllobacterium trifolii TaxID=300193 RepID=A0A839UCM2_9HYPH|nr:hypothetical protein [Phyllobacterium trifolii]